MGTAFRTLYVGILLVAVQLGLAAGVTIQKVYAPWSSRLSRVERDQTSITRPTWFLSILENVARAELYLPNADPEKVPEIAERVAHRLGRTVAVQLGPSSAMLSIRLDRPEMGGRGYQTSFPVERLRASAKELKPSVEPVLLRDQEVRKPDAMTTVLFAPPFRPAWLYHPLTGMSAVAIAVLPSLIWLLNLSFSRARGDSGTERWLLRDEVWVTFPLLLLRSHHKKYPTTG